MWQVHHHLHHMASSNRSIIKVHPNPTTTTLNPDAPVFEPPPPYSSYDYPPFIKRMPLFYCPQRWTWASATSSAFPQYLHQYQQPSFLSQYYYWPYYVQGHHHQESGKPTLPSHVLNTYFDFEDTTTVVSNQMKDDEEQRLASSENFGLYGGRKRVIAPRLMKKPKGISIFSDSSSNINGNKRPSFYGKKWIQKQHLGDDQKGNVLCPENSNINVAVIPESETEIIEPGGIKCNDVCGPEAEVDNSTLLCGKTTVMIRNVPNQLGREHLLKILDEHCRRVNMNIESSSGIDHCWSEYDFVYLPIDFRHGLNKGYAFVNFTTDTAAVRFWQAFHQLKWESYQFENSTLRSRKICQICWANIQGKEALRDNFRNRVFPKNEYRPSSIEPPSDGRGTTICRSVLIGYKKKQTK